MKKKTLLFLLVANGILLTLGWVMALYAYPRLPQKMPLWINFFKQQVFLTEKSLLFFLYPLAQTLFCLLFWWISRFNLSRDLWLIKKGSPLQERNSLFSSLRKEYIYLNLIFFNLIFIHLQRTVIFLAHEVGKGVNRFYFISVCGVILILIPWYRLRKRLLVYKIERGEE